MANDKQPTTIKKYANRRLYNTGTSAYVTLEDLAEMVKRGEDFVVYDAKTGEEITRSVLTQIIFEQEGKNGQSLLPIAFLRQLIRFYGDSIQMLVPSYLEFTIDKLTSDQHKFREQFGTALGSLAAHRADPPDVRFARRADAQEHGALQPGVDDVLAVRRRKARNRRGAACGRKRRQARSRRDEAPARRVAEAAGETDAEGVTRRKAQIAAASFENGWSATCGAPRKKPCR